MNAKTLIIMAVLAVAVIFGLGFACSSFERIEPNYAAVLIDYTTGTGNQPTLTVVTPGTWRQVNPVTQRIAKFPVAQQTLSMVRATNEGQVKGDDSVECQDQSGIQLNVDSRTLWRVNPNEIGQLYLARPGMTLVGSLENSISGVIVRGAVRTAILFGCSQISYILIHGQGKPELAQNIADRLAPMLAADHLILDQFQLGEDYLHKEQQEAINAQAAAQQQALAAGFLAQKARAEAEANVATVDGKRRVTAIEAQTAADKTKIDADAEANRVRTAAQASADKTRLEGEAQANALALLGAAWSKYPGLSDYYYSKAWDGKLPTTVFGGNGTPSFFFPTPAAKQP